MTRRSIPRADLYLIAITFIWGSTFSAVKYLLGSLSPMLLQGVRFSIASVVMAVVAHRDIRTGHGDTIRHGLLLGLLLGTGFALQTVGLTMTTASRAGFLTGTMVVFTPLFQLAIERRAPTVGNILGVGLVLAGLYLLTSPDGGSFNLGDLLELACAVAFAAYIVYLDVFTREAYRPAIVFYQFVGTAAVGFLGVPFESGTARWDTTSIALILYLAVFASALAITVQSRWQRESTPTRAALIFSLEPVIAAVLAWLWLGELLEGTALLGAVVILAGLLISELLPSRRVTGNR